jgi:AraC-like DNA-binding protein
MFRAFRSIENPGVVELPRAAFSALDEQLDAAYEGRMVIQDANSLFESVIEAAGHYLPKPKPGDSRIDAVVARIQAGDRATLKELAAAVELSPSRLRHLFAETVGITLRSYGLWQKMRQVPIRLAAGMSLSEVAYECGFTDSAHMAAAFQNIHGAPPSYFFNSDHIRLISWNQEGAPLHGHKQSPQSHGVDHFNSAVIASSSRRELAA